MVQTIDGRKEKTIMLVLVRNVLGSSSSVPPVGSSWSEFWAIKKGRPFPTYCAAQGCYNRAEVGAHVKIYGDMSGKIYIVPLCYNHNNDHSATFYVDTDMLVLVE